MGTTTLTLQALPVFPAPALPFCGRSGRALLVVSAKGRQLSLKPCEPALDDGNRPSFSRLSVLGSFPLPKSCGENS